MCTVSAIYDYGRAIPGSSWTAPVLDGYKKLIEEAEAFDTLAGEPDCVDPKKAEWLALVEELVVLRDQKAHFAGQVVVCDEEIKTILAKLGELA